jgi:hypothetical protein
MQGYQAESTIRPSYPIDHGQEYETREFRLSEYSPQVTTLQNKFPSQQDPANTKSPSRKCWEVNNPTVRPSVPGFASPSSVDDFDRDEQQSRTGAEPHANDVIDEDEDSPSKKVFSMFICDEPEKIKEVDLCK